MRGSFPKGPPEDTAINADDDYVRSDLPSPSEPDDREDDPDYRRVRRREYDVDRQGIRDREHLRILSILFYVYGGLLMFGGLFPLIYVFMGAVFVSGGVPGGPGPGGGPPPEFIGWILIMIGGCASVFFLAVAGCCLFTGYNLSKMRRYTFCFVIACLCCINIPLGTVLGVFTIVVLARPTVKELFNAAPTAPQPAVED